MRKALTIGLFTTLLAFLGPKWAFAGDIVIGSFQGLNTQDNPVALEDGESQDLLNVGITPGGKSAYKREGFGLHKTLSFSTSAVHGLHYFQDLSGSDIQLYGHDIYISASVNGASPVDLATGTVNATWQCTDNSGFAYCVTSSRNSPVRTSGTTGSTTYPAGIPLGTMVTNTPDRLVVSGVSGNESSLYFSQANTFTNFTIGINSADPFVEIINSPGSRITHIRYACGKLLWWKDGSFGYSLGSDQYNLENVTVSQNIGTLDNSSDEYNGMVYFRGQDNHIYQYDCSNVTRLSRKITPTVAGSGRRRANSWTQSSQSDFAGGAVSLNGSSIALSTSIVSGEVRPSSITLVDTSSANFTLGSSSITIDTTTIPGSVTLKNYVSETFTSSLGSFSNGSCLNAAAWDGSGHVKNNVTGGTACITLSTTVPNTGSITTMDGHKQSGGDAVGIGLCNGNSGAGYNAVYSFSGGTNIDTLQLYKVTDCTSALTSGTLLCNSGNLSTLSDATITLNRDATGNFTLYRNGVSTCTATDTTTNSFTHVKGYIAPNSGTSNWIDNYYHSALTGNFTSRVFDTAFLVPVYGTLTASLTNSGSLLFATRTSLDGTSFNSDVSVTTGSLITSLNRRYIIYSSTISATSSASSLPQLTDVSIVAASTGTYYSAVNNASNISSFGTFGANDTTDGGTLAYYVRASTGLFTILSSTPNWVSQSKNATVNYATGTYMQMKAEFSVTYATATTSLNDFSFNWFEGNSVDKSYIKYWNDYVWVAVSSGTTGLNNRIQRWDILNQTWLLDDIPANGFLVDNNNLYFGSPTAGKVYKYGNGVTTDDSGSINAYWKSKNFSGDDPFVQKNWDQSDFVVKAASPTVMSVIYQLDGSTTTTYSMNLYHPTKTILHKGVNLSGRIGTFYNVRFGDSSSNPRWEVFGYRSRYTTLPWRPE